MFGWVTGDITVSNSAMFTICVGHVIFHVDKLHIKAARLQIQ